MKNRALTNQVEDLKRRVHQLEQETANYKKLDGQLQSLIHPDMMSFHGPDTLSHLENFSVDGIIEELRDHAPDVLALVEDIGKCGRFEDQPSSHTVL